MNNINLTALGWDDFLQAQLNTLVEAGERGTLPGRVSVEHRGLYQVYTAAGEVLAEISGKMRHQASSREDLPAVGDWVCLSFQSGHKERAIIHRVLDRKSRFSRKVAGKRTDEQIIAANIDTIFLVTALSGDYNLRRIERYLMMAWESGASPVIILNKADLFPDDPAEKIREVEDVAAGVPVYVISCLEKRGLAELECYLQTGKTIAFIGSSGVGKSTLINLLIGEERQKTSGVRESDQKGRHTTTRRELIVIESGGVVIDTPGMRELQLWHGDDALEGTFRDIEELALKCKFTDCEHRTEPGCAVKKAINEGGLAEERLDSYRKLQRELVYLEMKESRSSESIERVKWKDLSRWRKQLDKR